MYRIILCNQTGVSERTLRCSSDRPTHTNRTPLTNCCIGLPIHCNYQLAHYSGFCRISPSILNRFKPNLQAQFTSVPKTRLRDFLELLSSSGFRAQRRHDFFCHFVCHIRYMTTYWSKIAEKTQPTPFGTFLWGDPLRIFR